MKRIALINLVCFAIFSWVVICPTDFAFARIGNIIHFDSGKSVIRPQSLQILNDLISIVLDNTKSLKKLTIIGNTDNMEAKSHRLKLSIRRAQAVKDYMIQKGVNPDILEIRGYGATRPVATNATPEGRVQNRRVEFNVTDEEEKLPDSPKINLCPTSDHDENNFQTQGRETKRRSQRIHLFGIDGIIFKELGALGSDCLGSQGHWAPSAKDVQAAETGILKCLQKYQFSKIDAESLQQYKRQYTGVMAGKRKLLWVDLYKHPDSSCPDWESKPCEHTCVYNTDSSSLVYDPVEHSCYNVCHSAAVE